jgi:hypothetical protein
MPPLDPKTSHDLDMQIASVMDCKFLPEDEVVRLCEKVMLFKGGQSVDVCRYSHDFPSSCQLQSYTGR